MFAEFPCPVDPFGNLAYFGIAGTSEYVWVALENLLRGANVIAVGKKFWKVTCHQMVFVVDMYRADGDQFYSFAEERWRSLKALGLAYGWSPRGTTPTSGTPEAPNSGSDRRWAEYGHFCNDYEPDDVAYDKAIAAEDAKNWAAALERAVQEDFPICDLAPEIVERFIKFLRRGSFAFSWDD